MTTTTKELEAVKRDGAIPGDEGYVDGGDGGGGYDGAKGYEDAGGYEGADGDEVWHGDDIYVEGREDATRQETFRENEAAENDEALRAKDEDGDGGGYGHGWQEHDGLNGHGESGWYDDENDEACHGDQWDDEDWHDDAGSSDEQW